MGKIEMGARPSPGKQARQPLAPRDVETAVRDRQ